MRIVIVGGGVAGLVASYAFSRKRYAKVTILEAGRVGGEYLAGGLRYIHATEGMDQMLTDIGAAHSLYTVRGGIMLHGQLFKYPEHVRTLFPATQRRIRYDHWVKTRKVAPDTTMVRSMNDPEATGPRSAFSCDAADVLRRLAERALVHKEVVTSVQPGMVRTNNYRTYPYDLLIWTAPLWVAQKVMYFRLPDALAVRLNVVVVSPQLIDHKAGPKEGVGARRDPYAQFDYVYTPYTPDGLIHRISSTDDGYMCEFNGPWPEGDSDVNLALTNDLNYLFPNGWTPQNTRRGLNGHLLPLLEEPAWPSNIVPLGRFAQWDARATADSVLASAEAVATQHGMESYE